MPPRPWFPPSRPGSRSRLTWPIAVEVRDAVQAALQNGDPHLVRLELAAVLDPTNAGAQLAVGEAYAHLDRPHDAERHFKLALALGRAREAHADLGALYLTVGMLDAAEHHARAALNSLDHGETDDTVTAMAHQTLASICEAKGELQASAQQLDLAYARQSLFRQPVAGAPFTTLVLVTRHTGNVPYPSLLPPQQFDRVVWYMEHARLAQIAELPPLCGCVERHRRCGTWPWRHKRLWTPSCKNSGGPC